MNEKNVPHRPYSGAWKYLIPVFILIVLVSVAFERSGYPQVGFGVFLALGFAVFLPIVLYFSIRHSREQNEEEETDKEKK